MLLNHCIILQSALLLLHNRFLSRFLEELPPPATEERQADALNAMLWPAELCVT